MGSGHHCHRFCDYQKNTCLLKSTYSDCWFHLEHIHSKYRPVAYFSNAVGLRPKGAAQKLRTLVLDVISIFHERVNYIQAVADPGQGWFNCILYIFLSPELRKRMFVRPFQRVWRRHIKKTAQRQQRELETSPLLGDTTNPLSAPARTQGGTTDGGTHTYLSFPTEFSHSNLE